MLSLNYKYGLINPQHLNIDLFSQKYELQQLRS